MLKRRSLPPRSALIHRTKLMRVDLRQVLSISVGEMEKNLARVVNTAERAGAALFFDEADALFGKRARVGDRRDRFSNADVGFLLQRINEARVPVVMGFHLGGSKAALTPKRRFGARRSGRC